MLLYSVYTITSYQFMSKVYSCLQSQFISSYNIFKTSNAPVQCLYYYILSIYTLLYISFHLCLYCNDRFH